MKLNLILLFILQIICFTQTLALPVARNDIQGQELERRSHLLLPRKDPPPSPPSPPSPASPASPPSPASAPPDDKKICVAGKCISWIKIKTKLQDKTKRDKLKKAVKEALKFVKKNKKPITKIVKGVQKALESPEFQELQTTVAEFMNDAAEGVGAVLETLLDILSAAGGE